MAIKEYIESTAVFTIDDFKESVGDNATNKNLLYRALESGKVKRIKQGVYASNTGLYRNQSPDPYLISEKMCPDAVFCYQSAFALLVGQHDLSTQVQFYTARRFPKIAYNGVSYIGYTRKHVLDTTTAYRIDGGKNVVTSKEQTIVDCLEDMNRAGGLERLLRTISSIQYVDEEKLLSLSKKGTASLNARLGWLLELEQDRWSVKDEVLHALEGRIGSGVSYLLPGVRAEDGYVRRWKLYLPATRNEIESWTE
jgi:predicted transcriptional regulator of viral defense system